MEDPILDHLENVKIHCHVEVIAMSVLSKIERYWNVKQNGV